MDKPPFEILGERTHNYVGEGSFNKFMTDLGLPNLASVLRAIGYMSAVIVILLAMLMLLIVNYPKTVAQTKTKIAHCILAALFIAILPLFMDVIYRTCLHAFYGIG